MRKIYFTAISLSIYQLGFTQIPNLSTISRPQASGLGNYSSNDYSSSTNRSFQRNYPSIPNTYQKSSNTNHRNNYEAQVHSQNNTVMQSIEQDMAEVRELQFRKWVEDGRNMTYNLPSALAPNHVYIKHNIKSIGWYNTELTSGIFPIDAWLSASGFIHLDTIKNGVFMEAMNNKESLALLLVDLANAYNRNYPDNDGSFALKCAERAIQIYPYLPNALLETHTKQFKKLMKEQNTRDIQATLSNPTAKELFETMNKEYTHIHKIGYRSMPEEIYLDWLVSLKTERLKYEDRRLQK